MKTYELVEKLDNVLTHVMGHTLNCSKIGYNDSVNLHTCFTRSYSDNCIIFNRYECPLTSDIICGTDYEYDKYLVDDVDVLKWFDSINWVDFDEIDQTSYIHFNNDFIVEIIPLNIEKSISIHYMLKLHDKSNNSVLRVKMF